MMLRDSLAAKIWSAIEKSPFTVGDFEVEFGSSKDDDILNIRFRHHPDFYLSITENYKSECTSNESPGEHKKKEAYLLRSLADIPERITVWARNVRDELRVTVPVYSELDELREIVERHINENVQNPNERFSDSEVDELREKLDELAKRFAEMQEKNELTEQEVNRLNQEIASIKTNLVSYPRGVWYKTAANKIWATVGKIATSQESRQVLAQAARKMLGLGS